MPILENFNGTYKEIRPWYENKNGVLTMLKQVYSNTDGAYSPLYTAEKSHWWKRYTANQWSKERIYYMGTGVEGGYDGQFSVNRVGSTFFTSYSFNTSTGYFTFSNPVTTSLDSWEFVDSSDDEETNYYRLKDEFCNTFTSDPEWIPSNPGSSRKIYQVGSGSGSYHWYSDTWEVQYSGVTGSSYEGNFYAKPVSRGSTFTMAKGTSATDPFNSQDWKIDENGFSYYSYHNEYETEYWREYNGYCWVYEGYHE